MNLLLAHPGLHEGGGLTDGRHDGAADRIGSLAAPDGIGGKSELP